MDSLDVFSNVIVQIKEFDDSKSLINFYTFQ